MVALDALRRSRAVCFDVDSTVITVEAIDEFAAYVGKKDAVAALTARAMGGSLPFRDALAARLSIIEPTRALLDAFVAEHAFKLTPGVEDFMRELRVRGADIFLVSGGFTQVRVPAISVVFLQPCVTGGVAGSDAQHFVVRVFVYVQQ